MFTCEQPSSLPLLGHCTISWHVISVEWNSVTPLTDLCIVTYVCARVPVFVHVHNPVARKKCRHCMFLQSTDSFNVNGTKRNVQGHVVKVVKWLGVGNKTWLEKHHDLYHDFITSVKSTLTLGFTWDTNSGTLGERTTPVQPSHLLNRLSCSLAC